MPSAKSKDSSQRQSHQPNLEKIQFHIFRDAQQQPIHNLFLWSGPLSDNETCRFGQDISRLVKGGHRASVNAQRDICGGICERDYVLPLQRK